MLACWETRRCTARLCGTHHHVAASSNNAASGNAPAIVIGTPSAANSPQAEPGKYPGVGGKLVVSSRSVTDATPACLLQGQERAGAANLKVNASGYFCASAACPQEWREKQGR